MGLLSLHS